MTGLHLDFLWINLIKENFIKEKLQFCKKVITPRKRIPRQKNTLFLDQKI